MRSLGINGEELRGQPANPGSAGKMAIKTECVCVTSLGHRVCICLLRSMH